MNKNDYILAIDQGTTSSRCIIFDHEFKIIHTEQREIHLNYPHNGWVEQDASQIWNDVNEMLNACIKKFSGSIKTIGITNQRETIVIWDKTTGKPIAPAIVWQDRRTHEFCNDLKEKKLEEVITKKTGLLLDPYFSATKIKWILDQNKDYRTKAKNRELLCGTMDSWIIWNLTGGAKHITDATNASRTMLYNIHENKWDDELLNLFDIPNEILPTVTDCSGDFGTLHSNTVPEQIPINGIAGDQQAALIGQNCLQIGDMKATYGTGCFALLNTGTKPILSKNRLLTTIAYRLNNVTHYALEGSIFVAGAAIQFLRDQLHFIQHANETEKLATSVPDTNGVYFIPALTGLGAPHWDSTARGAIFGLTRDTNINHIIRATLEAQAYQTNDLIKGMVDDSDISPTILRIDGGLTHNNFMCQFLSDILNVTIERPEIVESTALGAALLAAVGSGILSSINDYKTIRRIERRFTPSMPIKTRNEKLNEWKNYIQKLLYTPL